MKSRFRSRPRAFALAHSFLRPDLPRAVLLGHALVAVGVIDRSQREHHVLEQRMMGRCQDLSGQDWQRLLAADFAGVNIADGQGNQLAGSRGLQGAVHRRIGQDQQRQRTSLSRSAQLGVVRIGIAPGQLLAEGHDLAVPGGRLVAALFRDGLKGVDLLWEICQDGQEECNQTVRGKHYRWCPRRAGEMILISSKNGSSE